MVKVQSAPEIFLIILLMRQLISNLEITLVLNSEAMAQLLIM